MNDITPDEYHGLKGKFKQWTSMGVIGTLSILTVYLVIWQNPSMHQSYLRVITDVQEKAVQEIKDGRDISRQEQEKSRNHGSDAVKELGEGLKQNALAIQSLNETFIRVQERTQENQKTLIDLQMKKMKEDSKNE